MNRQKPQSKVRLLGVSFVTVLLLIVLIGLPLSGLRIGYSDSGIVAVDPGARLHAAIAASTPPDELKLMFKGDSGSVGAPYKGHYSAIHWAAVKGEIELLDVFLEIAPHTLDWRERGRGDAPIHYAIRGHQLEAVTFLLDRGANIELTGQSGLSPLDLAEQLENDEIAELLRQRQ